MRSTPFSILFAVATVAGAAHAQRTLMQSFGNGAGARFGASLTRLDDLDGDGFRELATGSPNFTPSMLFPNTGAVTVINGRTGAFRYQVGPLPAVQAKAGTTLACIGDVTGDGHLDFVQGAPNYNGGIGCVTMHNGYTGALLWTCNATGSNLRLFGTALATCGDVTGDGLPDVLVGAPNNVAGSPGVTRTNGATGVGLTSFVSGSSNSQCGITIVTLSDMTGDGRPEVAIGEPRFNFNGDSGRIRVMDPTNTWTPFYQLYANFSYDIGAGQLLANAGDVDGDGKDDLLCAYRGSASSGPWTPRVTIFSGASGNLLNNVYGLGSSDTSYGKAMAGIGDYDGDGRADFAVGAPDDNGGAGRVVVYSGRTFAVITTFTGAGGSHFGTSIAPFGDYDGDGKADFAVGAPDHVYNGAAMGRVSVHGIQYVGGMTFFGTGCAPQVGAPSLQTWPASNVLRPGGNFTISRSGLTASSVTLWIWGLSNTVSGSTLLPLDLTPFGIASCNLLVSPDAVVTAIGSAAVFVGLPSSPTFAGVRFFMQAAALGAGTSSGIALTDGADILIGHQ